ncbi:MAG: 5'/3'-nucleotidase SurE [Candidatus Omnitrophota bacterium]
MHILLTNDDGINAEGLNILCRQLKQSCQVTVCAPETEQSAISHAITLNKPLRVKEVHRDRGFFGYTVDGTPADCVKLAVRSLIRSKLDFIISGINHGPNLGSDIMYSGTVSAACEGAILGIPSIAVSLATYKKHNFNFAVKFVWQLVNQLNSVRSLRRLLLNVNIPALPEKKIRGVKITRQGRSFYEENFIKRIDPRGRIYYWLGGKVKWLRKETGSDIKAVENNFISITPLQFDFTARKEIRRLRKLKF